MLLTVEYTRWHSSNLSPPEWPTRRSVSSKASIPQIYRLGHIFMECTPSAFGGGTKEPDPTQFLARVTWTCSYRAHCPRTGRWTNHDHSPKKSHGTGFLWSPVFTRRQGSVQSVCRLFFMLKLVHDWIKIEYYIGVSKSGSQVEVKRSIQLRQGGRDKIEF